MSWDDLQAEVLSQFEQSHASYGEDVWHAQAELHREATRAASAKSRAPAPIQNAAYRRWYAEAKQEGRDSYVRKLERARRTDSTRKRTPEQNDRRNARRRESYARSVERRER